jgi:hypothetical protein
VGATTWGTGGPEFESRRSDQHLAPFWCAQKGLRVRQGYEMNWRVSVLASNAGYGSKKGPRHFCRRAKAASLTGERSYLVREQLRPQVTVRTYSEERTYRTKRTLVIAIGSAMSGSRLCEQIPHNRKSHRVASILRITPGPKPFEPVRFHRQARRCACRRRRDFLPRFSQTVVEFVLFVAELKVAKAVTELV